MGLHCVHIEHVTKANKSAQGRMQSRPSYRTAPLDAYYFPCTITRTMTSAMTMGRSQCRHSRRLDAWSLLSRCRPTSISSEGSRREDNPTISSQEELRGCKSTTMRRRRCGLFTYVVEWQLSGCWFRFYVHGFAECLSSVYIRLYSLRV